MQYKVTGIHLQHDDPYSLKRRLFELKADMLDDLKDITHVIETLAEACKHIRGKVAVAGLTNLYGTHEEGENNESGDV
jgi:fructose-1,6-bisphosphatase